MRILTDREIGEILIWHAEGLTNRAIALKYDICEATVSNVVLGKRKARGDRIGKNRQPLNPLPDPGLIEMDFSLLPDDVLFKHERPCDFIG